MGGDSQHRAQQLCVIGQEVAAAGPATASCNSSSSGKRPTTNNCCSTSVSSDRSSSHEKLFGSTTGCAVSNSSSGTTTPQLTVAAPQNSTLSSTICSSGTNSSVPFCLGVSTVTAAADTCYCKLLVSNHLAGIIIGQAGSEIRTLKSLTGAKIVLSPHGMYFPGTTERVAALEGPESSVLHVLDWILDKLAAAAGDSKELAAAAAAVQQHQDGLNTLPLQQQLQQQLLLHAGSAPISLRLCVPRAVVGSLIGRSGGYIQSLRVASGASINISPLFVSAEEACAERIISIESRKTQSLRVAAFTLLKKINAHPDKASCRHVCYYRKHNFDSPLVTATQEAAAAAAAATAATTSSSTTAAAAAAVAAAAAAAAASPSPVELRMRQHMQKQQQQQQQQQQRERELLRRRALSLVMGAHSNPAALLEAGSSNSSTSSSSSSSTTSLPTAEDTFAAAFKRFCEARAQAKAATKNNDAAAAAPRPIKTVPSLTRNMREVIEQSRSSCKGATAAATVSGAEVAAAAGTAATTAAAATEKGPADAPWDLSSCSTAAGSTDKLPTVSEDSSNSLGDVDGAARNDLQQQQQQRQHQPSLALLVLVAVFLAALLHIVSRN